jgi:hypothetical protein
MDGEGPLPAELVARWKALLASDRSAADELYFGELLPDLLAALEQQPEHRALRAQQHQVLVSLMGFSPETTIISAALLRPQWVLVVLSEKGEDSYDRAHEFLTSHRILRPSQIQKLTVSPTDPVEIYREIKRALSRIGSPGTTPSHIFDVTGGKKIMSATAGQVAWEEDWPLCYIESPAYDPEIRRPLPGHERLIRLPNPSRIREEQARRAALETYASRHYVSALEAFRKSQQLRAENQLECLAVELCRCYVAWSDLDLPRLDEAVGRVRAEMAQPRMAELLNGSAEEDPRRGRHLRALAAVAGGETMALLASFFELASLYRAMARHDFACLLAYRSMEALVEMGLQRAAGPSFRCDAPNYEALGDKVELERRYVALSARLGGHPDSALPRKIGFLAGLGLLCLVSEVHQRGRRPRDEVAFLRMMRGEAERRNSSVLAHGFRTLTEGDSEALLQRAESLAEGILGPEPCAELQALRRDLAPLSLEGLARPRRLS